MINFLLRKKQRALGHWQKYVDKCQGCGLCINACPIGKLSPGGLYAPRGRISLIRAFFEGQISKEEAGAILSVCLHCGQCEKCCPSGLPLQDLFTEFAALVGSSNKDPLSKLLYLLQFFPSLSGSLQFIGALVSRTDLKKKLPSLLGDLPLKAFSDKRVRKVSASGGSNSVLLFSGCLARNVDPAIAMASAELVKNLSRPLLCPTLPCCGRINRIMGKSDERLALVRKNLKILSRLRFEHILTPCPACAQEIGHYWPLTKGLDKGEKALASMMAEKVINSTTFMHDALTEKHLENDSSRTLFIHISCLSSASEKSAIEKIFPSKKYSGVENGENCCGSSLLCSMGKNPVMKQLSDRLGRKLRDEVLAQGAELLFTTCPACKLHLKKIMARNGDSIQPGHVAELYARITAPYHKGE